MAKIKNLSEEELLTIFNKGDRLLSFSEKSPFRSITTPLRTIFVAWESDQKPNSPLYMVGGGNGSVYIYREGDSESPLKTDVYTFHSSGVGGARICDVEPKKIGYHHSSKIIGFIEDQMPEEYLIKCQDVFKRIVKLPAEKCPDRDGSNCSKK